MEETSNFIKTIMKEDLESGRVKKIVTRFPPEPNAYLHIGHARAMVTNFELAKSFGGYTNLRFDDTNPTKEDAEFVDAIINDIKWLGYEPKNIYYGSDYFEKTYELAIKLIKKGLAYVCDLNPEEISQYRGTLNEPGKESPYRNRSVEENLQLFENMKNGMYDEGTHTLRAKIDMASPNINMRDPVLYRIVKTPHHRQGTKWCIYPMYDFAHPLQDSFEGITHSLCSLEYDNHRPLYDWVIKVCEMPHVSHQYEFGRLNITNTVMSKRYLRELVETNKVEGYDDPRMPTLAGLRRRGYTPEAIRNFILSTGLSRVNSTVEGTMLEHFLREDLKLKTNRLMAITNPLEVEITNYPEGEIEYVKADNNAENEELGTRKVPFGRHLYIEREDFVLQKPNKHYKRLALGLEVRLYHAYFIK
ncbi:MAG: glutamine--tRNA ligase, partial [Bacilli bacterium]